LDEANLRFFQGVLPEGNESISRSKQSNDYSIPRSGLVQKYLTFTNIFVERLWRIFKYEDVYLNDYVSVPVARKGLGDYFEFYNSKRPHASLARKTPFELYYGV